MAREMLRRLVMTKRFVVVCALIAALGLAPACGSSSQEQPLEGNPTTDAIPPDALRTCRADGDCVKVHTSCNGCCAQDAVNVSASDDYGEYKTLTCQSYVGPVCSCVELPSRAVCRQKKCVLIPS